MLFRKRYAKHPKAYPIFLPFSFFFFDTAATPLSAASHASLLDNRQAVSRPNVQPGSFVLLNTSTSAYTRVRRLTLARVDVRMYWRDHSDSLKQEIQEKRCTIYTCIVLFAFARGCFSSVLIHKGSLSGTAKFRAVISTLGAGKTRVRGMGGRHHGIPRVPAVGGTRKRAALQM